MFFGLVAQLVRPTDSYSGGPRIKPWLVHKADQAVTDSVTAFFMVLCKQLFELAIFTDKSSVKFYIILWTNVKT